MVGLSIVLPVLHFVCQIYTLTKDGMTVYLKVPIKHEEVKESSNVSALLDKTTTINFKTDICMPLGDSSQLLDLEVQSYSIYNHMVYE